MSGKLTSLAAVLVAATDTAGAPPSPAVQGQPLAGDRGPTAGLELTPRTGVVYWAKVKNHPQSIEALPLG